MQYVGSRSLIRDENQPPRIGSPEFEPLDGQGSPSLWLSLRKTLRVTDFPGGASANAGKEARVLSLSQEDPGQENLEDPLEEGMASHSYLENSMDRGACQATYSPWGCKELDMTEQLSIITQPRVM